MLKTIIGFILLLFPFLLMGKFKDKKIGFSYILSFSIAFHLFVAIITQSLKIFTYPVILIINLAAILFITTKIDFRKIAVKIDWILIGIIIIAFMHLFSVHYNYTGKFTIATTPEYQAAKHMKYPYPYFVDEWYSIAFIKDSIKYHSLPFNYPFAQRWKFINLEFPFHSFLSEIMLLLDLNPLTDYTALAIFYGLLICLLIYTFLRESGVSKLPAAITSLSALYITNGANLPGVWTLIPIILGIISLLLGFIFFSQNNIKMVLFLAIPTILFYPPMFIFYIVVLISFLISSKEILNSQKIRNILYFVLITVILGSILAITYFLFNKSFIGFVRYIWFTKFYYNTFTESFNPYFIIHRIIPVPVLILALLGIILIFKKKIWLISLLFLGILYWIIYSFTTMRFIFEYERVVFLTSILVVIFAGFGLSLLIKVLSEYIQKRILDYIQLGILLLFFVFSFNYTPRENWQSLKLVNVETKQTFLPAAPANRYLHPDDLTLFANISNKTFLSLPWKGTVIGVATNNHPWSTKPGTITINKDLYFQFMGLDCSMKEKEAKRLKIEYLYTPKVDCPAFELVGTSSEGLYLYKILANES